MKMTKFINNNMDLDKLMKDKTMLVAFMAVLAIGSGIGGYGIAYMNTPEVEVQSEPLVVPALFSGHLMIEARDADGNIKAVREADNIITQNAEDCAMRALFSDNFNSGTASTGSSCVGAVTAPWTFIAVGTDGTQEVGTQQTLVSEVTNNGLVRAPATTVTWANSTGSEPNIAAQIVLTKQFTVTGGPQTILEAGLFNGTLGTTDSMFARKTFGGVSVDTDDTLTVQWTISIGNTTTSVGS